MFSTSASIASAVSFLFSYVFVSALSALLELSAFIFSVFLALTEVSACFSVFSSGASMTETLSSVLLFLLAVLRAAFSMLSFSLDEVASTIIGSVIEDFSFFDRVFVATFPVSLIETGALTSSSVCGVSKSTSTLVFIAAFLTTFLLIISFF